MDISNLTIQITNATNWNGATLNGAPLPGKDMIYASGESILKFCRDSCTAFNVEKLFFITFSLLMLFFYLVAKGIYFFCELKKDSDPEYPEKYFYMKTFLYAIIRID
jgi:hypothetical protein